jgi:hypothetical protein
MSTADRLRSMDGKSMTSASLLISGRCPDAARACAAASA